MGYSKGPWKYIDLAEDENAKLQTMDDRFVVQCKTNIPSIPGVVARCGYRFNAKLIAAAPDLLEACKAVKELNSIYWLNHNMAAKLKGHEKIGGLINKATTLLEEVIAKAERGE